MSDDRSAILAVASSFALSAGMALAGVVNWFTKRRDVARDRERQDHDDEIEDEERLRKRAREEEKRAREEADNSYMWERRCRRMDGIAHDLRHGRNNDRFIMIELLRRNGIETPQLPDNPPIPRLEDL